MVNLEESNIGRIWLAKLTNIPANLIENELLLAESLASGGAGFILG